MMLRKGILIAGAAMAIMAPVGAARVAPDPDYTSQPGLGPHLWPAPMTQTYAGLDRRTAKAKVSARKRATEHRVVSAMIRVARADNDTQSL
jgi:hypothetical protein